MHEPGVRRWTLTGSDARSPMSLDIVASGPRVGLGERVDVVEVLPDRVVAEGDERLALRGLARVIFEEWSESITEVVETWTPPGMTPAEREAIARLDRAGAFDV